MNSFDFSPIGHITSCYKEKFGIPRQPGLVSLAKAQLILKQDFTEECIRSLQGFSHLWLSFVFHGNQQKAWKALVRPPRLGGDSKVGVFASRSPFRPNPLGLSVVKLEEIEIKNARVILHLSGCDLLDETPVLDIKPYLPYVDSISDAMGGFAHHKPDKKLDVVFTEEANMQCQLQSEQLGQDLHALIEQILQLDPRPSYQQGESGDRVYAMKLYDFDLRWQYCENKKIKVLSLLDSRV